MILSVVEYYQKKKKKKNETNEHEMKHFTHG